MDAKCINPILNVSDISASFAWFEKWGSKKLWDWRTPPTLGVVGSGECEIFVCQGCQGGRGKGVNTSTFGPNGDEESEKGVWMAVFVNDVDDVYTQSVAAGLEVTSPQTDISGRLRSRDSERQSRNLTQEMASPRDGRFCQDLRAACTWPDRIGVGAMPRKSKIDLKNTLESLNMPALLPESQFRATRVSTDARLAV